MQIHPKWFIASHGDRAELRSRIHEREGAPTAVAPRDVRAVREYELRSMRVGNLVVRAIDRELAGVTRPRGAWASS